MKSVELSPENQSCAAQALASILSNCGVVNEADVKQFGELVAVAFIAMESHESTATKRGTGRSLNLTPFGMID